MTNNEMLLIARIQREGLGYKKIAAIVGLPVNTVKAYCRRHPVESPVENTTSTDVHRCRSCGKPITLTPHKKERKFCSDKCRLEWWNSQPELMKRKTIHTFTCACCHKTFQSHKSEQKYCSRKCYDLARRRSGQYD